MGFKDKIVNGQASKVWTPNSKPQREFLSLSLDIFEALYGGEAGGGKTEVLLALPIASKDDNGVPWFKIPWFKAIYFRKSYPQIRDSLIPRSFEFYPHTGASFNQQFNRWTWPSGAWLRFGYLENKADAYKYDTNEYNLMIYEELTEFHEFCYLYPLHRVRGGFHIVRAAATPGNIGNSWVYDRFVKPAKDGYQRLIVKYKDGHTTSRIFIPARLEDNINLLEDDPGYIARLNLLPEAERRAKRGDWFAFAGQVFREFRTDHYPDEPENAIHVIPPFAIPAHWPKVVAIDWGYDAMTWAGFFAVSPKGRVYLMKEYTCTNKPIATWATELRLLKDQIPNVVYGVIDPSSERNLGEPKTIKQQVEEHLGMFLEKATNDRVGGKALVHEYLRFMPKEVPPQPEGFSLDIAQRILRLHGPERYYEYLGQYDPPKEDVTTLPKLQIFQTCPFVIDVIPRCVYKEKADDTSTEDVKEFKGDDPYDGLRYGLKAVHRFVMQATEAEQLVMEKARILDELQASGDMNAFYRQMSKFDRANDDQPISLFHNGNPRIHGPY